MIVHDVESPSVYVLFYWLMSKESAMNCDRVEKSQAGRMLGEKRWSQETLCSHGQKQTCQNLAGKPQPYNNT